MTKGIAIQTILLLLVGILVVGIVVYMVYRYFVGAPIGEQECRAKAISWCTTCENMDYSLPAGGTPINIPDDITDCAAEYGFGSPPASCDSATAEDWCKNFII